MADPTGRGKSITVVWYDEEPWLRRAMSYRDLELLGDLSEDSVRVWVDWLLEHEDPDGPRMVAALERGCTCRLHPGGMPGPGMSTCPTCDGRGTILVPFVSEAERMALARPPTGPEDLRPQHSTHGCPTCLGSGVAVLRLIVEVGPGAWEDR